MTMETDSSARWLPPSAEQGLRCDALMRYQLSESLLYLRDHCEHWLASTEVSALSSAAHALQAEKRLHPAVFGHYAQWVYYLIQDNVAEAHQAARALLAVAAWGADYPASLSLEDASLSRSRDVISTLMLAGDNEGLELVAPDASALEQAQRTLDDAWALARERLPDLAAEMQSLVAQIILVGNAPNARLHFDGGSSYMLWGALIVNAEPTRSSVAMLELLAHETAHLLLFAAAHAEPLVTNPETERYPSPLREDLRPMDGIYHATWVSARMAWAMRQLALHPATPAAQAKEAESALTLDLSNFHAGHEVVRAHGQLTPTGERVMDSAASWVATLTH